MQMANALWLMPFGSSSWLIAKKQRCSQLYMQKRNKTELHITDHP